MDDLIPLAKDYRGLSDTDEGLPSNMRSLGTSPNCFAIMTILSVERDFRKFPCNWKLGEFHTAGSSNVP
jgi:hypothetical protein